MEAAQHEDPLPANNRAVKLPLFWTANLQAWFTSAEGAFRLRNIAVEESRFFNCLQALPETTVSRIAILVEADPLPQNPYTELRRSLLAAHQLTDIQRVEQLHNLPPLAAQKPSSELLAEMLPCVPGARRTTPSSTACSSTSFPGSSASFSRRRTWRTSRRWAPEPTSSPPTTASRPMTWWRWWPPFLPQSKRERRPHWLQSAQEPAAGNAAAAADSEVAAGGGKKKQGPRSGGGSGQQVSHTLTRIPG
jgi:hypothetical protein